MNKIVRISALSGLLGALLCLSYFCILTLLDFNPLGRYKYIYIGLYALPFIFGLRYLRDRRNNGGFRFGRL